MTVINTNVKALYTQAALKVSNRDSQVAMQQLSTGKRINSSKDDAAGLAIAARMTQNIKGLNQAVRNAGDAISMIQTAEGATQEITVMLQRMSELAVQAANSTYSTEQRGYLNEEFQQLKQEIVRISDTHEWNGFPILNGKAGMPVGAPNVETNTRAGVPASAIGTALKEGDLEIQTKYGTFAIPASLDSSDPKSNALAFSSNKAGSAIAIAAAINSQVLSGVSASAKPAVVTATKTDVGQTSIQTDLYVNGEKVPLSLSGDHTRSERRQYVMESINAGTAVHGVTAGDGGGGGLTLTTTDGRNLSVWYDSTTLHGYDFGLGLDTATASDPLGVTGIQGLANVTAGSVEASSITFPPLRTGQELTVNGLTFKADNDISANDVAAAFGSLSSGMTGVAATATHPQSAARGSYSGTFYEGFSTQASSGATVVATATRQGNVGDIALSGSTSPVVTVSLEASSPPVVASSIAGSVPVACVQTVDVAGTPQAGDIYYFGVKTSMTATTTAGVAAAIAANKSNILAGSAAIAAGLKDITASGSTLTLTFTAGATGTAGAGVVASVSAVAAEGTNTSEATLAAGTVTTVGVAGTNTKQVSSVTFSALDSGQSITLGGLKFTAGASGASVLDLKSAFASLTSSSSLSAANTALISAGISPSIGVFSGGPFVAGTFDSQGVFTATTASNTQINLSPSSNKEVNKVKLPALSNGQTVTVGGLTLTADSGMTDVEVAAAFAGLSASGATPSNPIGGTFTNTLGGFDLTSSGTPGTILATSTSNGNAANIVATGPKSTAITRDGRTVAASTAYGTVVLTSNEPFTIKPGSNAFPKSGVASDPTYTNFRALGFEPGTINPKNIGRLSFQVGPAENQLITIDMADFGPNGEITGPITSMTQPTNLLSVQASNDVIKNVNKSLDRIAEVRATMGAVMNRLEHVIDNLTNVVMNSEASRSQIEDADYAQASTELARTQIMQQAATAVLAQANTSQQTVLKLLQG